MSRISIGLLAACGLVLGIACLGRNGHAQEPKGTSSTPAKASSPSSPRGRMGMQSSEPLVLLKSGSEHTRLVCRLKNAPCTDVAHSISNLLRQEGELVGSAETAASSKMVLHVAISPDPVSNSLIISGPPDAVNEVVKLIEPLDQAPPVVQFDVEIGEVAAGEARHGDGLKSEGNQSSDERPRTFYVLERPKTMKTIAHPRVASLDNQPANIQLGQKVPTITSLPQGPGLAKNATSSPTPTVTYQNVGLNLAVTPRVNVKEGIVIFLLDVEDARVGPESEGIPLMVADNKVVRLPRIESLSLQTTIAIPDGKTVMIGSIGRLGKDEKELVVILTPHVIRPEDGKKTGP